MHIAQLEEDLGLSRASIRFYEKEGLLFPERLANGYRDYSEEDLALLLRVRLLRELGLPVDSSVYTVDQAVRELQRLKGGKASC